jgi:hypothetical protein
MVGVGVADPEPVETGGTETEVAGAWDELGARFTGIGWRGPDKTCPGRGEPAAGIGRGGGGMGRPGAAGENVEAGRGAAGKGAAGEGAEAGRGAPIGG